MCNTLKMVLSVRPYACMAFSVRFVLLINGGLSNWIYAAIFMLFEKGCSCTRTHVLIIPLQNLIYSM
jgi:hypothetical protein